MIQCKQQVDDVSTGSLSAASNPGLGLDPLCDAANAYLDFAQQNDSGGSEQLDSWCASYKGSVLDAGFFRDAHRNDPELASRLADGIAALPKVGGEFCGFKLISELGRGAFGRVFLGHQGDLADRPVALKVSTEIRGESQRLARLQHTNIVPIYSFHRQGALQAVCMPYFGSATLADLTAELHRRNSLPDSGKMVVSTVCDRRSRTLHNDEHRIPSAPSRLIEPAVAQTELPVSEAASTRELKRLEGLTYVESILWIGARLADGLAHAHERGILHRDLKPANVLLTDEGQPMLLDFNLAEDRKTEGAAAQIGGTLPYMAPEHLEAFGGAKRDVDARSDLYGLGVILFELLTGQHPFPRYNSPLEITLQRMIEDRHKGKPTLRGFNKTISPATEAIVRKCLEPDPARRYQSARELQEDLERQLANLPLRHQCEPSRRERVQKWMRRNPRLISAGPIAVVSTVLIAGLAAAAFVYKGRLDRESALTKLADFQTDFQAAQALLCARDIDRDTGEHDEDQARTAALSALNSYGVLSDDAWREQSAVRQLSIEERKRLTGSIGELLVLLAGSLLPNHSATIEQKEESLRLNQLAEKCFDEGQVPQALWVQRAELVSDAKEAKQLRERASQTPVLLAWDHYLAACGLRRQGKFQAAAAELRKATEMDPNCFAAWFMLGIYLIESSDEISANKEASTHFTTCASLRPKFYASYYNRGLAHYFSHDVKRAEADFTQAIQLCPSFARGYLCRAEMREKLGKFHEALADIQRTFDLGGPAVSAYLDRSKLRELMDDKEGAEQDFTTALQLKPVDYIDWRQRGIARLDSDPQGALEDFVEAARLKPRSRWILQYKARALGEYLKRPNDAILELDKELHLYPNQPMVLVSRGVYHAQLDHRSEAHADARLAVQMAPHNGQVVYRAANIYALTSKLPGDQEADRRQALALLVKAMDLGFGHEYVEGIKRDEDLEPLLNDPDFKKLRQLTALTRMLKQGKENKEWW